MDDLRSSRDAAHVALLEAIHRGDPAVVQPAAYEWMRAWEAVHDDRPYLGDIEQWSGDEAAQVVANLEAGLLAGPEITAVVVRCINSMGQPEPAALSRPLTLPQLVSAAWTRAAQRVPDRVGWWSTDSARTTAAALAERCCTTGRYDDVDVEPALVVSPGTGGRVPWEGALAGPEVERAAEEGPFVLSFVLRAGETCPGVTWWPGPQEHVRGWPHPLPEVPEWAASALQVPSIDVYEREAFTPAPLLLIGHGPRRLPDLGAIEAAARAGGAEVVLALGTLSPAGLQLIVRTTGPVAVFEQQPGLVNLTSPD